MKEKELEATNLQAFLSYKKEIIEAGKLILSPGLLKELMKEPDDIWRVFLNLGLTPDIALMEWQDGL